jgi:hypothetical protein
VYITTEMNANTKKSIPTMYSAMFERISVYT